MSEYYVFPPDKGAECQAMLDAINNHPALPMPCATDPNAQPTIIWQDAIVTLTDGRHTITRIDEPRRNMIMSDPADQQAFLDTYLTPHGGTIEEVDSSLFQTNEDDLI